MYAYLAGRLVEKDPTKVVLDVGGIGYQVQIPVSTYASLPPMGESTRLLTHFVVREDSQALFGFYTEAERYLFRLLISISGIGPKLAVTILSGISVPDLKEAIVKGMLPLLTGISGVGKKTAERIVVELREKLVLEEGRPAGVTWQGLEEGNVLIEDSIRALVELGYRRQNAKGAVEKVMKESGWEKLSVPDFIRASLRHV